MSRVLSKQSLPIAVQIDKPKSKGWIFISVLLLVGTGALICQCCPPMLLPAGRPPFYSQVKSPKGICEGVQGDSVSHAGFIGLEGDSEQAPKRSFFWYFEAQTNAEHAPVILSMGGGPGTSGMANPFFAQSPCIITANGTIPNDNAWTEHYNLVAIDHPIGTGYSHGPTVDNSQSAARDVYDFLQKFFLIYPHLSKNQFIITGGSYGGIYVPNIAAVIHQQNTAIASGKGLPGAIHINLESLIVSNPFSNPIIHFRWFLQQACYNTNLYNSTTCAHLFSRLPVCLDMLDTAFANYTVYNRHAANTMCNELRGGDTHGVMAENVEKRCDGTVEDCFPYFGWLESFMNSNATREQIGVPDHLRFRSLSEDVGEAFGQFGDHIQRAELLYEPLLRDGIRLIHYIGAKDANCAWPGVLSTLNAIPSQYQTQFTSAPDVPWPTSDIATVRVVGEGAGKMTYVLLADAGHFVSRDQPALAKKIVWHWVEDVPFL